MDTKRLNTPTGVGGIALIVIGLLFFLITQGVFNLNWGNSWPFYMMLLGAVGLVAALTATRRSARGALAFLGTLLLLLSLFFLATTMNYVTWDDQGKLWPLYLLILGLSFLSAYAAVAFKSAGYLLAGAIFTALGLILLATTLTGLLDSMPWPVLSRTFLDWGWPATWWPAALLLIGGGLLALGLRRDLGADRPALVSSGSFILLLGIFFQATSLGLLSWRDQGRVWPVYLIFVGVALLAGRSVARPHRL